MNKTKNKETGSVPLGLPQRDVRVCLITLGCALFFPDRKEELRPELWAAANPEPGTAALGGSD